MMKEKTNPKSVAPRKVKGSVLFTVVCVMMVMIVFLLGTLALAATATKRANKTFQKAQTEATARAVLDAAIKAVQDDTAATGIRKALLAEHTITVTLDGQEYDVNVVNTGEEYTFYDTTTHAWTTENRVFALTVTVDKMLADTTYTAYLTAKGSVEDESEDPPPPPPLDKAFVAMGNSSKIGTGGYITGGTAVGVSLPKRPEYYTICDNDVYIDGPWYINGNAETGTGNGLALHITEPGDLVSIIGDFKENQANQLIFDYTGMKTLTSPLDYTKTPGFYVDGNMNLHGNSSETIGLKPSTTNPAGGIPTNVYCGALNAAKLEVYGDIYTFDPNGTSSLGASGYSSSLYDWTKAAMQVDNTPNGNVPGNKMIASADPLSQYDYGNWFSKGNIKIYVTNNPTFAGDLRCDKNITFEGNNDIYVNGDVICGGTLNVPSGVKLHCRNVYANNLSIGGNIEALPGKAAPGIYACSGNIGFNPLTATKHNTEKFTYTPKNGNGFTNGIKMENGTKNSNPAVRMVVCYTRSGFTIVNGVRTDYADEDITKETEWLNTWEVGHGFPGGPFANNVDYASAQAQSYINEFNANNGVERLVPDFNSALPAGMGPIYPRDYEKDKIKDTIHQQIPSPTDFTSNYNIDAVNYKQPKTDTNPYGGKSFKELTGNNWGSDVSSGFYRGSDGVYNVTGNAWINGNGQTFDNMYINATDAVTIVLENVKFDTKKCLVINDAKQVNLHIVGTVEFGYGGGILTKSYWDKIFPGRAISAGFDNSAASGTLTIHQNPSSADDWDFPNVYVYSDAGATLKCADGDSLFTCMIRAPRMNFIQGMGLHAGSLTFKYIQGNGTEMTYGAGANAASMVASGEKFDTNKLCATGVIGQVIADNVELNNTNTWGLLYISSSNIGSGDPDEEGDGDEEGEEFAGIGNVLYYGYY